MKAEYRLYFTETGQIDLTNFGHDEETKYEDLTEDQKNEITDSLRDGCVPEIDIYTIKPL